MKEPPTQGAERKAREKRRKKKKPGNLRRCRSFNQFTGREQRARRDDYCYSVMAARDARLSNPANTPPEQGGQIER